jgi:hypothetical protein
MTIRQADFWTVSTCSGAFYVASRTLQARS